VAYEYWFDGGWRLLDGDQNGYFLDWDNRSLVSARALWGGGSEVGGHGQHYRLHPKLALR